MFDALQDTPRDFQFKLMDALNSLGQTMEIPPTECFDKVLCASDDQNPDVKKKMYNWWRAFFEVLGKVTDGKMPKVSVSEFNQKIDDLMAEIMKAGDKEASGDNNEVVLEEFEQVKEDYEEADKVEEDEMNKDFDFAIQHIGEIANKVKDIVNFVNPYCETKEVYDTMKKTTNERGGSDWVPMKDIVGMEVGESDDDPINWDDEDSYNDGGFEKGMWVIWTDPDSGEESVWKILEMPKAEDETSYDNLFVIGQKNGDKKEVPGWEIRPRDSDPVEYKESWYPEYGIGEIVSWKDENDEMQDGWKVIGCDVNTFEYHLEKDGEDVWVDDVRVEEYNESKQMNEAKATVWCVVLSDGTEKKFKCGKDEAKAKAKELAEKEGLEVKKVYPVLYPRNPYKGIFKETAGAVDSEKHVTLESDWDGKSTTRTLNFTQYEADDLMDYIAEEISHLESEDSGLNIVGIVPKRVLEYIEMKGLASSVKKLNPREVVVKWAVGSNDEDEFAPAKGISKSVYDLVKDIYEGNSEYSESQQMNEASVVVDANDVWEVLDLLDDPDANKNLTDLINSHVRTEDEIMDAINSRFGAESPTKVELNDAIRDFWWIVSALDLDVEQFKKDGSFVDTEKPVTLEGSIKMTPEQRKVVDNAKKTAKKDGYDQYIILDKEDGSWSFARKHIQDKSEFDKFNQEVVGIVTSDDLQYKPCSLDESDVQKPDEVKGGEKKYKKDGETKTLVTGSDKENKKEMTDADAAVIMGGASETDMDAADMGLVSHKVADPYNNKKEVTEMTIEQEIDNPWKLSEMLWGQGRENLRELLESELFDEDFVMQMIEDMEIRDLTAINDAFAYDFPTILDMFGCDPHAWSQNLEIKMKDGEDSEEEGD